MKVKAVYDNGGKTFDRFTVVYDSSRTTLKNHNGRRLWECVGSSMNPNSPHGFFQHSDCTLGKHLGKRITFADLPEEVRKCVERDLQEGGE